MDSDELDFELPADLIAQEPCQTRGMSRLLHYRRADRSIRHGMFSDLAGILRAGDVMVFNDTKVLPARLRLRKTTGGGVDGLFIAEKERGAWRVLLRNIGSDPSAEGMRLAFESEPNLSMTIRRSLLHGEFEVEVTSGEAAGDVLSRVGRMPLPPYIHRGRGGDQRDELDRRRYQTVYAKSGGSVAAPTAGLHFTDEMLDALAAAGIQRVMVTLHVGMGTFKPVTSDRLEDHIMHEERYEISATAAEALDNAKRSGRRIVAVGTTAARVLESHSVDEPWTVASKATSIFIYPPYAWKHVGALVTNFHLPRSTLIALVAAMTGLDEQRRIYAEAIAARYRFFSYGDAMLIE